MALTLIATTDYIVAKDHPKFTDIKNRDAIYLHGLHLVGHDADGKHDSRLCACVGEQDTFVGNGTFPRAISLSNTALTPKVVVCWEQPVTGNLVTNGEFEDMVTGWTAVDCSIAALAGGVTGKCLEITQGTTDMVTNGGFGTNMTGWTTNGTVIGGIAGGQSGNCCRQTHAGVSAASIYQQFTGHLPGATYLPRIYGYCVDATLLAAGQNFYLNGEAKLLTNTWTQRNPIYQHFLADGSGEFFQNTYVGLAGGPYYIYYDTATCIAGGGANQTITVTPMRNHTLTFYVKSGTSGNEAFRAVVYGDILYAPYPSSTSMALVSGTSSGTWTQYTLSFIPTTQTTVTIALIKDSLTAGTMLFDSVSVTENPVGFPMRVDSCPYSITNRADLSLTMGNEEILTALTAGSFTVNKTATGYNLGEYALNTNGKNNYYLVLGTDETSTYPGDTGSGTDPDWVEDDEQMLGGAVGTEPANKVEQHIYDALIVAHTATGAHTANPFADLMAIETGTATGTGAEQTVTLENTGLEVKEVFIFKLVDNDDVYTALDSMTATNSKKEDTAAFTTGMIQGMGTGEFSFIGTASAVYYWGVLGIQ